MWDSLQRARGRTSWMLVAAAACGALLGPAPAGAQYFGRNKVQYQNFDFRVMRTQHFDLLYYPAESVATADAARMVERWYGRHSRTLTDEFSRRTIVLYADHPDFEQTNVVGGFIDQSTGGVTESGRSRVVLPFTGVYAENDHVLGHELVHVFQYDIAGDMGASGMAGLNRLPLWLIEGMAEYLSLGRDDPNTAMWLRDAALRNDLPTIRQLTTDPRYFPYRYGQALWAFIGGTWGDEMVNTVYRGAIKYGWDPALRRYLGLPGDSVSKVWLAQIRRDYLPLMEGRQKPGDLGTRLLPFTSRKQGDMDVAPALSPDGKYVAFFTRRGLFEIELYLADAETGKIVKKLTGPSTDNHFDAISFINSSGGWSPDGQRFAFIVQVSGDRAIEVYDLRHGSFAKPIRIRGVGDITDVSWGPDDKLALSGSAGGISDLYILDLKSQHVTQLTRDRFADLQPRWSPDGKTIAFATDRGATNFDSLAYGPVQLALYDVASGDIRLLHTFDRAKAIDPQWTPDGTALYFVSDRGGFDDIYRLSLADSSITQVTHFATGVSGITALSPAITVARQSGRMVMNVFDRGGYSLFRLEPDQIPSQPVTTPTSVANAGLLPPLSTVDGVVEAYLNDPVSGLPPADNYKVQDYHASLGIDYLGSPGVGVGVGPYGAMAGGGIAAYFSDALSNHVLGATLAAGGYSIKDTGGELFWLNQRHRWNWYVDGSHIPYLTGGVGVGETTLTDPNTGQDVPAQVISQILERVYVDQFTLGTQYPFSQTRRFEVSLSATHLGYGIEQDQLFAVGGQIVGERINNPPGPPGLTYYGGQAALVGDYSVFGMTSPVAGGRWRLEYSPIFGDVQFQSVLADYRRYFFMNPLTLAFRGIHYGRYGRDAESGLLSPLYVGQPYLVRGYSPESFTASDCAGATDQGLTGCPQIDRLIGSRIGVANVEFRIPITGPEGLGLINLPYLPIEIAPFADGGVAWTSQESPTFTFSRNSTARIPVFSAGVTTRLNLLGYAVLEFFWAYPFQRPGSHGQFGFQIQPGW